MNDVPLVKANNIHDINTSIIAIKKQLKQLNEAVGLIDMPTIDTSIFVKKSEVVDVIEEGNMNPVTSNAVVPVDEVTSGNIHSVTSNAVYNAIVNNKIKKMDFQKTENTTTGYNMITFNVGDLRNKNVLFFTALNYHPAIGLLGQPIFNSSSFEVYLPAMYNSQALNEGFLLSAYYYDYY